MTSIKYFFNAFGEVKTVNKMDLVLLALFFLVNIPPIVGFTIIVTKCSINILHCFLLKMSALARI